MTSGNEVLIFLLALLAFIGVKTGISVKRPRQHGAVVSPDRWPVGLLRWLRVSPEHRIVLEMHTECVGLSGQSV